MKTLRLLLITASLLVGFDLLFAWDRVHAEAASAPVLQPDDAVYLPMMRVPPTSFAPSTSITLSGGEHAFTSLNIPAGVTVTVEGDVHIQVVGDSTIEGSLIGDCTNITLRGQGFLVLTGQIQNTCSSVPDNPEETADVKLIFDGMVQVGAVGMLSINVIADGSIIITDSFTENAPLTPINEPDSTLRVRGAAQPQTTAQAGPLTIDGALQATRRGNLRVARDGDVTINAAQVAPNGADAAALNQAGTCDASTLRGQPGGNISLAARNGTLRINANLTAGNGGKGGSCTAPSGCPAVATGGPGGRGGSVLVGGQNVIFAAGVTLTRGNGGAGGDAEAVGDEGAAACDDGCTATATGGTGGVRGGIGYVLIEPGQIIGAPNEAGGNGGPGGAATATGGDGRDCDVCPDGDGGAGGDATATGGQGGNGATGNIWPVVAGTHRAGDGGNATATGGDGGDGASCCEKLAEQAGGDGGSGGNATATAGDPGAQGIAAGNPGVAGGSGGNGGNGGDGAPPGAAGTAGTGTGAPNAIPDGAAGQAGDPCPELEIWFIYYSALAEGALLPNSTYTLSTYVTTTLTAEPTGQVVMRPQTEEEFGKPVSYEKFEDFVYVLSGGMVHDLSLLPDFPVISVRATVQHSCEVVDCVRLIGLYEGEPVHEVKSTQEAGENEMLALPPPPEGIPAYDGFILAGGPFRFFHWWVVIVDP